MIVLVEPVICSHTSVHAHQVQIVCPATVIHRCYVILALQPANAVLLLHTAIVQELVLLAHSQANAQPMIVMHLQVFVHLAT